MKFVYTCAYLTNALDIRYQDGRFYLTCPPLQKKANTLHPQVQGAAWSENWCTVHTPLFKTSNLVCLSKVRVRARPHIYPWTRSRMYPLSVLHRERYREIHPRRPKDFPETRECSNQSFPSDEIQLSQRKSKVQLFTRFFSRTPSLIIIAPKSEPKNFSFTFKLDSDWSTRSSFSFIEHMMDIYNYLHSNYSIGTNHTGYKNIEDSA